MGVVFYLTYEPGTDFTLLKPKRWPGLFIALVVSFLRVWAAAARIRFLSGTPLSWRASFRIILAWDFTSSVTPSTIGGAPMATYAMTREKLSLGQSTAIVLFTILLDQILYAIVIPFMLLSSMYYEIIPANVGMVGEWALVVIYCGLLIYAGLLTYAVLINPRALGTIVRVISNLSLLKNYKSPLRKNADELIRCATELRGKPFIFIFKAFLLTAGNWLARNLLPTIVILSLLPAPEILSFLRSIAMNFAFFAMPTPGGSGGVEGLFTLFQAPLIEREVFIGIALFVWRFISYYISIGLGIIAVYYYLRRPVKKGLNL